MFLGIIVMCLNDASISLDNCLLYNSPMVYETVEECVGAVNSFMLAPSTKLMVESGYSIERVDCYDALEGFKGNKV
jgi:hypothetical protein